jgi:hypothetical protein
MNNLIKYDEFVNESLFGSRFRFIYNRIKKYIKTVNPADITFEQYQAKGTYNLLCRFSTEVSENDPYGEEENSSDMKIKVQRYRADAKGLRDVFDIDGPIRYRLIINDETLPISNSEAHSLFIEMKNRKKMEKEIEKKKAQDELYNKYKEIDKTLQKKIRSSIKGANNIS